ncbi:MAG TPA: trehalose-6-phosphate synthase, partial [Actinomycetota bacterium]|nr:trehalose-6-phosphate synthase [Actinomycetota bacterium]
MTTTDRVLVASNRGPVWFADEDGELSPRRGSGGLVAALASAVQTTGGLWVSAAMGPGDRRRAAETPDGRMEVVVDDTKFGIRLLAFDPKTYDRAYNQVSNRILWFVHHRLWDLPRSPIFDTESRAAWEAYRRFSRSFAEALAQEVGALPATVLVQDYHLALVPAFLRAMAPQVRIAHFSHVPFADPDTLRLLPGPLWRELLTGMLGADLLGFHTERWADAFLACCRGLEETSVRGRTITREGRTSRVGVFPISIEAEGLRARAGSELVRHRRKELVRWRRDRALVLRVDRLDPSKNILRGFLAFEDLLRRRPGWRGRVVFLALLNPSRQGVPEYRAYAQECLAAAGRINGELGDRGWQPIDVRVNDDIDEVLAAYALYNVLMVNPVFDG